MERLTTKIGENYFCNAPFEVCETQNKNPKDDECCCACEINTKTRNKLGQYEDAEEQGLLLRLPIAEGTQVFCIGSCGELCDDYETDCEACGEHQVVFSTNFDRNMIEQFGETVFATEKEAEAILHEMQEGE